MEEISASADNSQWRSFSRPCTSPVINCAQRVNPVYRAGGADGKTGFSITDKPGMAVASPPLSSYLLPSRSPPNTKVEFSGARKPSFGASKPNTVIVVMKASPPPPPPPPPPAQKLPPQLLLPISNKGSYFKSSHCKSSTEPCQQRHDEHVGGSGFISNKALSSMEVSVMNSKIDYGSIAAAAAAAALRRQQKIAPPLSPPNDQPAAVPHQQLPLSPQQAINPIVQLPSPPSSYQQQEAVVKVAASELQSTSSYGPQEATMPKAQRSNPVSGSQSFGLQDKPKESLLLASNVQHCNKVKKVSLFSCRFMRNSVEPHHEEAQNTPQIPHGLVHNREQHCQGKVDNVSMKSCGLFCISHKRRPVVTHVSSPLVRANSRDMPSQSAKVLEEHLSANSDDRKIFHKEVKLKLQQTKKSGELTCETSISPRLRQAIVETGIPSHNIDREVMPETQSDSGESALKITQCIAGDVCIDGSKVVKTCPSQESAGSQPVETTPVIMEVASLEKSLLDTFFIQDEETWNQTQDGHEVMVMNEDESEFYDASCRFECQRSNKSGASLMSPLRDRTIDEAEFLDAPSQFNSPSSSVRGLKYIDSSACLDVPSIFSLKRIDANNYLRAGLELDRQSEMMSTLIGNFSCSGDLNYFDSNTDIRDKWEQFTETQHTSSSCSEYVDHPITHARVGLELDKTSSKSCGAKTASLRDRLGVSLRVDIEDTQVGLQETANLHRIMKQKTSNAKSEPKPVTSIFPPKCQRVSPSHGLGWPFGLSGHQSFKMLEVQQGFSGLYLNVPSPPLPPCPSGSWLENAITLNASKKSALTTLQRDKELLKAVPDKLEYGSCDAIEKTKWEDIVTACQMQ